MRKYFLPLIILSLFILDSIIIDVTPLRHMNEEWTIVPRLIIISLILVTIFANESYGLVYSFLFGLLYDVVYTDIIGIYMFAFTVMSYIVSKIMKIVHANVVVVFFITLIGITLVEYFAYGVHSIIGSTRMVQQEFLLLRLLPTLAFNGIATILFMYPLKKFCEKLIFYENED